MYKIIAVVAALLVTTSTASSALTRHEAETCLNQKLKAVLHQQADIRTAFDVVRQASRVIGPEYRELQPAERQIAHYTIAIGIKEALEKNLHRLKALEFQATRNPTTKRHTFTVDGELRRANVGYHTTVIANKRDCVVQYMVVEGTSSDDWVRESDIFQEFMEGFKLK